MLSPHAARGAGSYRSPLCVAVCAGVTSSGTSRTYRDRAHQRPVLEAPCWSVIALLVTNAHSSEHVQQPDGWADAVINFYFANDPSKHICELQVHYTCTIACARGLVSSNDESFLSCSYAQLVHEDLMKARADLDVHHAYCKGRAAGELLRLSQVTGEHGSGS